MTFTAEEIAAIKEGKPVRVAPVELGTECVVLRADLYERLAPLLASDEDIHPRDTYPTVLKALDACDASPEQYLEYLHEEG